MKARFFHAVLITFLAATAFMFYTPILSARKRNPQAGIYTLRDPDSGETFQVQLNHEPTSIEIDDLINQRRLKALGAELRMHEATVAIEERYEEPAFEVRTFLLAKGELESIPEAMSSLAMATVHPLEFAHKITAHPRSTMPFVADGISLGNLYTSGTLSPTWFEQAGKDVGLGTLFAFLVMSYGIVILFLKWTPDSALAGRIRWFFATPIFFNHANLNTLRNWAQKWRTFRIESEGTERVQPMGYANLNRRHKAMLFLTLIVTGLLLFNGLAIGKGLGTALLGVAAAWVVGSKGFLAFVSKARKGRKDFWKDWTDPGTHFDILALILCALLVWLGFAAIILGGIGITASEPGSAAILFGGIVAVPIVFLIYRKSQSWARSKRK